MNMDVERLVWSGWIVPRKYFSDKILKDIFWALSKKIENNENLARQLQKTGFAFNNKYLIFLQLVTLSWKLIVTISTTSRALFEPFHFGLSRWSYLMCQRHKDCDNPRTNGHNDQWLCCWYQIDLGWQSKFRLSILYLPPRREKIDTTDSYIF